MTTAKGVGGTDAGGDRQILARCIVIRPTAGPTALAAVTGTVEAALGRLADAVVAVGATRAQAAVGRAGGAALAGIAVTVAADCACAFTTVHGAVEAVLAHVAIAVATVGAVAAVCGAIAAGLNAITPRIAADRLRADPTLTRQGDFGTLVVPRSDAAIGLYGAHAGSHHQIRAARRVVTEATVALVTRDGGKADADPADAGVLARARVTIITSAHMIGMHTPGVGVTGITRARVTIVAVDALALTLPTDALVITGALGAVIAG